MRQRPQESIEEKLDDSQYQYLSEQQLLTEAEVMQQEVITHIPPIIHLLMKYEWKPIIKVLAAVFLMVVLYLVVGWDAVISAIASFLFLMFLAYLFQTKFQERDSTIFVEMKIPGQKITVGDHSPYSKEFYTTEKRFGIWEVPNALIRRGLFRIPGDQEPSVMPGTGKTIFVDLFDRVNRTCVLPRDMDVANIAMETNMNPLLAQKMSVVGEQIKLDKRTEQLILDYYSQGKITDKDARDMLTPIRLRYKALMRPTGETKRDIFFELQSTIPEMREKLQEVQNKIFILADFLAARGIYQILNRPMPEDIRKDHERLYGLLGLPNLYTEPQQKKGNQ